MAVACRPRVGQPESALVRHNSSAKYAASCGVAWPTRAEVVNYSSIVLLTLAVLMAVIFCLDYAFAKSVFYLFETPK